MTWPWMHPTKSSPGTAASRTKSWHTGQVTSPEATALCSMEPMTISAAVLTSEAATASRMARRAISLS